METVNDLLTQVLRLFPNAEIGEDNDGQLVIYTGLSEGADGVLEGFAG